MKDYTVLQKVVHWVMGFFIMLDLNIAQKFGRPMELEDRLDSRIDHSTLGTIILFLLLLRVILRIKIGAPRLPQSMTAAQVKMAKLAHIAMYSCIFALVFTGLITAANATDQIVIFGGINISFLNNMSEAQFLFVRQFHNAVTWIMILLIVIHTLAALVHHFWMKDDILRNMLTFWKKMEQPNQ
jgi:cytochrome b561